MLRTSKSLMLLAASFHILKVTVAFVQDADLRSGSRPVRWISKATRSYNPPDFTVLSDDDDGGGSGNDEEIGIDQKLSERKQRYIPDFSVLEEDTTKTMRPPATREKRKTFSGANGGVRGVSWMKRNDDFVTNVGSSSSPPSPRNRQSQSPKRTNRRHDGNSNNNNKREGRRPFQKDFRGTRVFVQGIPKTATWQDLKDHFRVAGDVVFASVSRDTETGESKGHGLVQFETSEMALTAIAIMRDHPMDGSTLYVREDVKPDDGASADRKRKQSNKQDSDNQKWQCADEENAEYLSDSDRTEVLSLIRARDDARRRKNFKVSDGIREELKIKFGIHLDDRLKMWWTSMDGSTVPQVIQDIKGEGRWNFNGQKAWSQIPTTPENDACVDPDLVEGLLRQRDIARREKDFSTADYLLEQARTSPDGDLSLRIHDESRTWRIWTETAPPKPIAPHMTPAERCIAIVEEHAPAKVQEIELLLEKFPGREYKILKKLKKRYYNVE